MIVLKFYLISTLFYFILFSYWVKTKKMTIEMEKPFPAWSGTLWAAFLWPYIFIQCVINVFKK